MSGSTELRATPDPNYIYIDIFFIYIYTPLENSFIKNEAFES